MRTLILHYSYLYSLFLMWMVLYSGRNRISLGFWKLRLDRPRLSSMYTRSEYNCACSERQRQHASSNIQLHTVSCIFGQKDEDCSCSTMQKPAIVCLTAHVRVLQFIVYWPTEMHNLYIFFKFIELSLDYNQRL